MALRVIGVRHHSPACARLVTRVLREVKPRWVLIEGPADFNHRLDELCLDHEPPVALFSYHFHEDRRYASWAPFCVHSPEWIALRNGRAMGAEVRFIDLPSWAAELEGLENRYADGPLAADPQPLLEKATGQTGYDAIWDACFELPDEHDLSERLQTYFDGLRDCHPASPSDHGRERFMARYIRWASQQGGDIVVVCGGFHAPVLARALELDEQDGEPTPPTAPDARAATWLIPFDEPRLDSFGGYASGLPSPAWYRWVWDNGAEQAPRLALEHTLRRLRDKGQVLSAADAVAAWTQAGALARLRGHETIARTDLLDAVTSTWVKEALSEPVPWSRREVLGEQTHPVLVELLSAMSGSQRGRLAADTPLPPLVGHVEALLEDQDLTPHIEARTVTVGERRAERLHTLERLVLLQIAGFTRLGSKNGKHSFAIQTSPHFEGSLLEAASYGPTLEAATVAWLEERAAGAEGFVQLVATLVDALRAGLPRLSDKAITALRQATQAEPDLGALGGGLESLVGLLRHGGLGSHDTQTCQTLVDAAVDRTLWLAEGLVGQQPLDRARVDAIAAVRDAVLQTEVAVPSVRVEGVLRRLADNPGIPADLQGSSLGALASLGTLGIEESSQLALQALTGLPPERLGDYLAGLLQLAREVLTDSPALVGGIDEAIEALDAAAFQLALPSLRVAFSTLPPRERARIGKQVAARRGVQGTPLSRKLTVDPALVARARVLEQQVTTILEAHGVRDE